MSLLTAYSIACLAGYNDLQLYNMDTAYRPLQLVMALQKWGLIW